MRAPFYRITYHLDHWTLADAFRPVPGWGSKTFQARVAAFGEHTEAEMLAVCREAAPLGHRLTCLEIYPSEGPERVIWSTPAAKRLAQQPV